VQDHKIKSLFKHNSGFWGEERIEGWDGVKNGYKRNQGYSRASRQYCLSSMKNKPAVLSVVSQESCKTLPDLSSLTRASATSTCLCSSRFPLLFLLQGLYPCCSHCLACSFLVVCIPESSRIWFKCPSSEDPDCLPYSLCHTVQSSFYPQC
jgi:hypothetical protein